MENKNITENDYRRLVDIKTRILKLEHYLGTHPDSNVNINDSKAIHNLNLEFNKKLAIACGITPNNSENIFDLQDSLAQLPSQKDRISAASKFNLNLKKITSEAETLYQKNQPKQTVEVMLTELLNELGISVQK